MELFNAIKTRRSIKKFIAKKVEEEKILKILEAGRWAPNAGNFQEFRFIIIKDKEKKERIAEACFGQYWMVKAPVYIVVVSKTVELERLFGNRGVELYGPQNSAAVIQNMLLTIHDLGLGSCWVGAFNEDPIKTMLEIPEEVKVMAILPIGYPAVKPSAPGRMSLEKLVFFEIYGNTEKPRKKRLLE